MQQEKHLRTVGISVQLDDERKGPSMIKKTNDVLRIGSKMNEYLSDKVERMSKICAKRRLNTMDKNDLLDLNGFFRWCARFGNPTLFRLHVQESTIKAWLNHVIVQIKKFTTNRNWIATGRLATYDACLLDACVPMMGHAVPVVLVFESDFFNVLADFVKARKGNGRALPCADICFCVTSIVCNAIIVSILSFDNPWTIEKALKKLEATGVLEQFIRCATVPQSHDDPNGLFQMLDLFQTCLPFISKNVRPGQPCGDVIIAILEGRDGSKAERPIVLNKLKTINRFALAMDPEYKPIYVATDICQKCNKRDLTESLMKCSRCQQVYYCSKECQKADWVTHKETCQHMTNKQLEMSRNSSSVMCAFCRDNYVHVMVKMAKVCEQTGLSKNDMLIDLNFTSNENGIVPAMQDNPEFTIAPVKDFIEGSRPAEPEWFRKTLKGEKYEEAIKVYLAQIEEEHPHLQPDQILCFVMIAGGSSVRRFSSRAPITDKDMYSQEAVNAFKTYMNDGDDGLLSEIFEPRKLANLKGELDYAL